MSVLIKNMKMPSRCFDCTFSKWSNLHQTMACNCGSHYFEPCFEDYSSEFYKKRADFCPLVEVPVPHGRIADMDESIKCIEEVKGKDAELAISLIEWACGKRTIIEAEEAEEDGE